MPHRLVEIGVRAEAIALPASGCCCVLLFCVAAVLGCVLLLCVGRYAARV